MNKNKWFLIFKHTHKNHIIKQSCHIVNHKISCDLCKHKNECIFHIMFDSNYTMFYNIFNLLGYHYAMPYSPYVNLLKTLTKNRYTYELFNLENYSLNSAMFECNRTKLLKNIHKKEIALLTSGYIYDEMDKIQKIRDFAEKNKLKLVEFVGNIYGCDAITLLIYKKEL